MKVYPHLIRKIICTGLNPRVYFPFECVSRELVPLFFTMHRPYLENNWCPREVYTALEIVSQGWSGCFPGLFILLVHRLQQPFLSLPSAPFPPFLSTSSSWQAVQKVMIFKIVYDM